MARPPEAGRAIRPRIVRSIALALSAALLAGCAGDDRRARKVCPRVDILEYANELVRFLPGPGRDVTDIVFRARLANFRGGCEVDEKDETKVEVELILEFAIERGPANRDRKAGFEYFVAIPQFHPQPAGKRRFPVAVEFETGQNRVLFRDGISVEIPLEQGQASSDFNIFIGHQLTAAELDYNQRGARPVRGPR